MTRTQLTTWTILILALSSMPGGASAQSLDLASGDTGFRETVLPAARISGSVLVGAQDQGPSDEVRVGAHIPAAWAGETVCSRVATIDGLYEATNAYLVPGDWTGGSASIPHPTGVPDRLLARPLDTIGVRITRGLCETPPREVAIGLWGQATSGVALLVNGIGAEGVFAYVDGQPIRCAPLQMGGRSAFDTRCDLSDLQVGGVTELEIIRVVGGSAMPATELVLWLP
jgi:hypothetical protein